jgi:hypothetical protein
MHLKLIRINSGGGLYKKNIEKVSETHWFRN